MTRHTTILAGRTQRLVRVEHRRKRKVVSEWSREHVHRVGLAAVADELGTAALLPMGGVMTGERLKALAGRKATKAPGATEPEIRADLSTEEPAIVLSTGLLADDVCRHIWTERGRFAPILYGADF